MTTMKNLIKLFCLLCFINYCFSSTPRPGQCIKEVGNIDHKFFYYGNEALSIKILTSSRLTHKIVSTILKVFAEEVLGYADVSLVQIENPSFSFEPDVQFANISSCEKKDCSDLDAHPGMPNAPRAMVNLETWVPSNFEVDDWQVEDVGPLGSGGRFGWYIPESFAKNSPPIKDHWRAFTNPDVTVSFKPSEEDFNYISKMMKQPDGSFYCEDEDLCGIEGMFIPPQCRPQRHKRDQSEKARNCALMITDFPVDSSIYSSKHVKKQIEELGLLVKLAFVGPNLEATVRYLETKSKAVRDENKSYLLFHYTPSLITHIYNLTSIKFDPCNQWKQSLYHQKDNFSHNCLYEYGKFAKVIWPKLKDGARPFYEALKKVEFSPAIYKRLLGFYEDKFEVSRGNELQGQRLNLSQAEILYQVACQWLNDDWKNDYYHNRKNYERWTNNGVKKKVLKLAGIFPISGDRYTAPELVPVLTMALDDINRNNSVLPNYDLKSVIYNGMCKSDVVMKTFINVIMNKESKSVIGFLGPACSDTVEPIAGVSKHVRSVVITYSAEGSISTIRESTEKNGKESNFPYFFRTIAENQQYKYAFKEVLKRLEWKNVASITEHGDKYGSYINKLREILEKDKVTFYKREFQRNAKNVTTHLNKMKHHGTRIIIGDFFETAARQVMCDAHSEGMTQANGYVWFLPGWYRKDWYDLNTKKLANDNAKEANAIIPFPNLPNCTTADMIEALQGHLSLSHANYASDTEIMQTGENVANWREKLNEKLQSEDRFNTTEPNKYSGYVYDAVWLYALALDKLIKLNQSYIQDIHSARSVEKFVEIIKSMNFVGVSGRINFPKVNGVHSHSRRSNIKIIQWYDNESHAIGEYEPGYSENDNGDLIMWDEKMLKWQTPDGSTPPDRVQECGFLSGFAESLSLECENAISLAIVVGFGTLFVILILIFIIVKRRYEAKMRQTEERMRALGLLTPSCVLTLDEWEIPRDRVVINRKLGEGAFGTVYGGEAFFDEKGWVAVAVKTLKTGSTVEEKLDFLGEADMMKRFDHKNIVKLLGVCTRNEPIYTVMEFMLYGDLKTYLLARRHLVNERNREEFDEVSNRRLTSMALDISRGLSYLAELKYVHRDLACRNCLVNSTRVVKLADFGMTRPMFENDYYRFSRKGMLPVRWMAPESLADGLFTPASDIWSYGVLLYEMITFGSFPFQGLSNNQVMEHVKAGHTLTIPSGIKSQLETLLKTCWNMTATKRPTASEIVELLSNNPRLISPCIDVPLASVQVERTDSLELIPSVRKPSGSVSQTNRPVLALKRSRGGGPSEAVVSENSKGSSVSGPYSPMSGVPCGNGFLMNGGSPSASNTFRMVDLSREPLLPSSQLCRSTTPPPVGSYVPPGYIFVDHSKNKSNSTVTSPERDKEQA